MEYLMSSLKAFERRWQPLLPDERYGFCNTIALMLKAGSHVFY
jgi:hypothetical protein